MDRAPACLLGLCLGLTGTALAADLGTLTGDCDGCHGPQGVSAHGDVPTIAGQSEAYINSSLTAFQQLGRPCRRTAYRHGDTSRPEKTMCELSAGLSAEDIAALAAHYSRLPFVAAQQAFDPALAATGREIHLANCESCHPEGGTVGARGPVLAGQWMPYLRRAMAETSTGEHLVPPLMERDLVAFTAEEIEALLHFLASRQPDR